MAMLQEKVEMCGLVGNLDFVRAQYCAWDIYRKDPDLFVGPPEIVELLPFDWDMYLDAKKKELRGETWKYEDIAMTFVNGELIGGPFEFISWAKDVHFFEEFRPLPLYLTLKDEGFKSYMKALNHDFVFLDISIGDEPAGRLVIELFSGMFQI
jgi:peptidyl-prolyl cis-trans isomerase-like 6